MTFKRIRRIKRKNKKKKKQYSLEEVRFIRRIANIKLVYLDNALLGFRTDEPDKIICGEDFLKWIKKEGKETVISFVNIYELRPLFFGKIKKNNPELSKKILNTLNDFNPSLLDEKSTIASLKKYKDLWYFLVDKLKVSEEDAAHFVIALSLNVDLFVSFNKRAFKNKKKIIANRLIKDKLKMPDLWDLGDIQNNLSKYNSLGLS